MVHVATLENPDVLPLGELFNADGTLVIRLYLDILYRPFLSLDILLHLFVSIATIAVVYFLLISLLTNVILIIMISALRA